MQDSNDVLSVWECFKSSTGDVLYFVKCHGLKDAVETSVSMQKEDYRLVGMYTYDQLVSMGIL